MNTRWNTHRVVPEYNGAWIAMETGTKAATQVMIMDGHEIPRKSCGLLPPVEDRVLLPAISALEQEEEDDNDAMSRPL